jgi:archaellum biogenesis protein FlaJ (TadC family)
MNKDAQGEHMVPLALCGRVPTKVKGTINKGDMMVTSNIEGVAVASDNPQIGTVIGKALENYDSEEVGTIEVVIGRL